MVLAPAVAEKQLAMSTRVAPGLAHVRLDRQKFKQVLLNLASNAVKFTDAGGRVEIELEPAGVDELRLRVSDTGIGIAREDCGRLFAEFHRIEAATSNRRPGTGLGLALTKRLVELQGGRIEVDSEPGVGSRFTVHLPLKVAAS